MITKIMLMPELIATQLKKIEFLGPLTLRLFLFPVFWMAGTEKLAGIENTIEWFGNTQWGLGLPYPTLLAYLATFTEIIGSICLLLGLATRLVCIPLIITMIVALTSVHWENGWLAISSSSSEASVRLNGFLQWLQQNFPKRHDYITKLGQPIMLNNGIEFSVTYLIMLLSLTFTGAGKYISADYWLLVWCKKINKTCQNKK